MRILKAGATSQSIYVEILDSASTTGGRKTGIAYNTAGLTAYYVRHQGSATSITLATLAAANSAYSSGGFKEVDATNMPGVYRLDVPDAAIAAGAPNVVVTLRGATGMVQVSAEIQLTTVDLQDAVRAGMTALPNAAAEAAGGLYTRGTGAGQINQPANGRIDVNAIALSGTTLTARDIGASVLLSSGSGAGQLDFTSGVVKANQTQILGTALTETLAGYLAAAFKKLFDVAAPVLTSASVNQTGDSYARIGAAGAGLTALGDTRIANLDATVSSRLAPTVAARTLDVSATGEAGVDWANVGSPTTAVGLTGTTISTSQAIASVSGAVGSVTGAVGSVTGAVGSVTGNVGGNVTGSVGSVTGAVGSVTAGVTLANGAHGGAAATLQLGGAGGLTATVTGNLTGSVGSVTGAVGSVTGAVGSVTGNVGGNVVGSVASVTGAVGSVTGSVGSIATGGIAAASFAANAIDAAALATDAVAEIADGVWDEALAGHLGVGSTGAALNGATAPTAAAVADAVWDEAIAGHLGAGSTGAALNAAGSAGDPWTTPLPGAYGAGTAGYIIGTDLDATISSRSTYAGGAVASVTGNVGGNVVGSVGSVTGAVGSVTGAVGSVTGSVGGNVIGSVGSVIASVTAGTVSDKTGYALAAAYDPAKTAAQAGDAMALTSAERTSTADALLDRAAGVETGWTLRQALRVMLAALAGKLSGAATTTVKIRDVGDTKDRITATVDADGNRTAVSTDNT